MEKKWYKSRSLYGAFVFAIALWGYTSFDDTYNTNIDVPVEVILPANRALKNDIPDQIGVQVRGNGWDLFNYSFFGSSMRSSVDLSNKNLDGTKYQISKTEMLNSLENLGTLEARSINSNEFDVYFGKIIKKRLPIESDITVLPRNEFVITSDLKFSPDSITIRGNKEILDSFKTWKTKELSFTGLTQDFEQLIGLDDTLSQILEFETEEVLAKCNISQLVELILPDNKLKIRGGILPENLVLSNQLFEVSIKGALEEIADLKKSDLELYIDYKDLINTKTGILKIKAQIDTNLSLLKISPDVVYVGKRNLASN